MASLKVSSRIDNSKVRNVSKDILEQVLLETMIAVEGHAKRFCPVKTGRLRASIVTFPLRPSDKIDVIANTNYAEFVEFGTSKMKAQPFMRMGMNTALKSDLHRIKRKHGLT